MSAVWTCMGCGKRIVNSPFPMHCGSCVVVVTPLEEELKGELDNAVDALTKATAKAAPAKVKRCKKHGVSSCRSAVCR